MQNKNHAETSASLSRITAQLTAAPNLQIDNSETTHHTQEEVRSVLAQSIYGDGDATSTQLRITLSIPRKTCDGTCNCQCHNRAQLQTPRWLSAAVGTLFYSHSHTPSIDIRPCNVSTCFRSQLSSCSRLTYYFPGWMMRTAVVYSTWSSIKGRNSSWFIKMPRELPINLRCWDLVRNGHVEEIKELLESREVSPYDIRPDGVSILHVSCGEETGLFVSSIESLSLIHM